MESPPTRLVAVGCNHHHTPLEIRERIALDPENVIRLQSALRSDAAFRETAVLNTCNRLEIYAVTKDEEWMDSMSRILGGIERFPLDAFLEHAYRRENLEAVKHAYRVASGLDSQMVGETQILGQMKHSYAAAIENESVGPVLHRFFQKAFQAAKWARTETKIGTGQVSLGNVAVELATRIFGKLTVSRTLVIGSGEAGRDVAKAFRSRGVACMSVASRTTERAEDLAREVDGLLIPFTTWEETLPYVDVAIFATAAPGSLLEAGTVHSAMRKRPRKPLFLIDLAVPRDVSTEVAELPNVYLYNLEDLAAIANENLKSRQAEIDGCIKELDTKARYTWSALPLQP